MKHLQKLCTVLFALSVVSPVVQAFELGQVPRPRI
jgi:hypothetical protein